MALPVSGGLTRLGGAKQITSVLKDLGADPVRLIRQAGLRPDLFEDENSTISYESLGRLLTACVVQTNCPYFGLLVGQKATISSLGSIGGLMLHSPTLGEALHNLVTYFHLHDRGAAPVLAVSGDIATLSYAIYQPGVASTDQIADLAIATSLNVMRALCGPEWAPDEVLLPRCAPDSLDPYRRFFRAPVRFDEENAALVFPARWLDHRITGADAVFHQVFNERVQELEAVSSRDVRDTLRRVLRTKIPTGGCSAESVAELFAVHRRTLHRHLRAAGMSFRDLTGEMRFEIACQLLADTKVPLSQIAAALGYSEASAFTRAFRRWSGQSPKAWRIDHRQV